MIHDGSGQPAHSTQVLMVGQALADMGGENRCLQVFSVESSALGTRVGNGQGVVTSVCISLVNTALPSSSL